MTNKNIFRELGGLDPDLIAKAAPDVPQKKSANKTWVKWASLAACLCLVVVGALTIPYLQNEPPHGQGIMEPLNTLPQAETMSLELVEWDWNGFKGVVVDAGDNGIFPADAELFVNFDSAKILLDDGTVMTFNPREPDTDAIGWMKGTIVTVTFVSYTDNNSVYASYVEVKK